METVSKLIIETNNYVLNSKDITLEEGAGEGVEEEEGAEEVVHLLQEGKEESNYINNNKIHSTLFSL